jgi:hypothetical protein
MSSVYIPRELSPLYTLIWRAILSYFTLAFGFVVFSRWVHSRLRRGEAVDEDMALDADGPGPSPPIDPSPVNG